MYRYVCTCIYICVKPHTYVVNSNKQCFLHSMYILMATNVQLWAMYILLAYVTGFGKTCIVHTSKFSTLVSHKIYLE